MRDIFSIFEQPTPNFSQYMKADFEIKQAIRLHLLETGRMENFIKRKTNSRLYEMISTTQKFDAFALKHNLFEMVFENLAKYKENEYFQCELIEDHFAWIASDPEDGTFRYFSMWENGRVLGLNIYDLIEIIDGVDFFNARKELARIFNIFELEDQWIQEQRIKYERNIEVIDQAEMVIKKKHPDLYEYIKDFLPVLRLLNTIAVEHIYRNFIHGGEHVFFASTNDLAKKLEEKIPIQKVKLDQPNVSRAITMFGLLGLISKAPHESLSPDLLQIAINIQNGTEHRLINFYQIPRLTEQILGSAEKIVEILIRNNMRSIRDITKKSVNEVFGFEYFKKVYPSPYRVRKQEQEENQLDVEDNVILNTDDIPF